MTVDSTKIATLKHTLVHATEFSEIADVFLNDLGNDPEFINAGDCYKDTNLATVVARTAAAVARTSVSVFKGDFMRIAEHRMVHGAFFLGAWSGMMFYFEDIDQGFIAVGDMRGPTQFVRFKAIMVAKKKGAAN